VGATACIGKLPENPLKEKFLESSGKGAEKGTEASAERSNVRKVGEK